MLMKGDKFNSLTVDSLISDSPNMKKRIYKCICDCGNEVITNEHSLIHNFKTSCGCSKSKKYKEAAYNDLVNKEIGKLTVLGLDEEKEGYKIHMKCRCNICGKIISVSASVLRNNTNPNLMCKDCYNEHGELHSQFKDITHNRYGRFVVDSYAYSSCGTTYWNCTCDCGKKEIVSKDFLTYKSDYPRCSNCMTHHKEYFFTPKKIPFTFIKKE